MQLPDKVAVVMDYIGQGELFDYVQERTNLSEDHTRYFLRQLADGKT